MPTGALGGVVSVGRASPRGVEPEPEYQAFPDVARRNAWQEYVEVPVLTSALGLPRGGRVLEVGCGRGVALPALAERLRPARLVGLDVERALLAEAAARLRERRCAAELVEADVRDMPFPDSSFDLVIDFGTCYHVARPHQALREVGRVLAAGGRFVHETRVSQLLSHPVRARRKRLPWHAAPGLEAGRHALLWAVRTKVGAVVALVVALALSASAAYGGWIDPGESAGVVFTGAEKSLGPTFRLVFEGYFGGQGLGLPQQTLIGAVRIAKGRWSVDLGVLVPVYESGTGSPFPLVTIARRF